MASVIRIKRSGSTGAPSGLASGELAYSALSGNQSNGGDRLYIGFGTPETSGIAPNMYVIGGKYFTDMLDHVTGTLTASSALIVDSNKKLDELLVDNLSLNGNTLSTTTGSLILNSETGMVQLASGDYIAGGSFDGSQLILDGTAELKQLRGGSVSLIVGAEGTATSSLVFNNDGSLTVPGTIKTLSNGNLTLTPNGTGKLVLNNPYIGGDSVTLAEFIYDTVGGAVTGGTGITVTNDDGANTSTIRITDTTVTGAGTPVGSSTAIPVITFNAQGQLTAVSTASITTTLGIAGDTGTDSIALATDTLTFTGGTGITSAVNGSTNTVTFDIDNTVVTLDGTQTLTNKTISGITVSGLNVTDSSITFEGATANDFETTLSVTDPTADRTITFPDATGTVVLADLAQTLTNKTISGASNTLSNIGNSSLTNSSVTIGSTNVSLGATSASLAGLTSVTFAGSTSGTTQILSGAIAGTSVLTLPVATDTLVGKATTDTLTNKTISGASNTLSNIANSSLTNSSVTFGSTVVALGAASTSIAGVTELTVDNININGNEIASTNENGNISLNPNGTGTVDVNGARISGLGSPTQDTDAATKLYVDTVAEGLTVKPAVRVATTANITSTYDNGTLGVGSTLTIPATATLTIDGVNSWTVGDGILVKNQTNAFENGRYFVSTVGNISAAWVLTRCSKCDEPTEIPSMYVFVQEGTLYASTGWVATVEDFADFDVGVDDITFTQFSGAGTYLAGNGLTITGSTFNVVGTADRITANADSVDIASTYVGQSSITTLGTITTGVWQGTIVDPTYGGTGVNNGSKTITLGGSFTHTGAHTLGLTTTANTSVTLPTTGTLATLAGTESLSNKTITSSSFSGTTIAGSGLITFTNSTDASNLTTAAVVLSGGLAVTKAMYVGTNITGAGAGTSTLDGFNIDGGTY
jgi:hypothetical protein